MRARAAEPATEGNRRETVLGGIESAAILNLDARLQLCEVEEVAPVDGQILDLLRGEDALDCGLLGVHGNLGSLHFNHLRTLS